MKTKLLTLFAFLGISLTAQVQAVELYMQPVDVTKWRIQTYTGVGVDVLEINGVRHHLNKTAKL